MAAYFTFSKSVTEQEDIESLLKTGVSFSLKRYTAMDQYLQNSDYRVYRLLSQKIHEQKKFVQNATEGVALVQKEKNLIFLGEGPYSEWLINRKPCDLKIGKNNLPFYILLLHMSASANATYLTFSVEETTSAKRHIIS